MLRGSALWNVGGWHTELSNEAGVKSLEGSTCDRLWQGTSFEKKKSFESARKRTRRPEEARDAHGLLGGDVAEHT